MTRRPLLALPAAALLALLALLVSSLAMTSAPSAHAAAAPSVPGLVDVTVATGVGTPTALAFAPDGRLFVASKNGAVRVVENGALVATPVLSLSVNTDGERGLIGMALAPDFATSGRLYVHYTTPTSAHGRVSWFTVTGNVASDEHVILDLPALAANNHNGGALAFGPDGMLYVAVGENAVPDRAQDLQSPFGKILRLTPDGGVPLDNPAVSGPIGYPDMVWASGLRNPFTMAFQPGTGRLFINDVGSSQFEEINEGASGANYGWPATEGPGSPGLVYSYGRGSGCSIIGGAFYNPAVVELPSDLIGRYVFSDFCGGWIRALDPASGQVTELATGLRSPTALTVGPDGGIYYGENGRVGRLGATRATPSTPVTIGDPSRFVPVTPERLLDTRIGLGAPSAALGVNSQIRLSVAGRGPVPSSGVEAVVLNVTATQAAGAGFVSVFPAGGSRPFVSNLNLELAGQTAANQVTVELGANGAVDLFSQSGTHLVADVQGYYLSATSSRAGRFVAAPTPHRLLDTRDGTGAAVGPLGVGGRVDLLARGAGPIPASGVSAIVLNLTGVNGSIPGFVTAWPSGAPRPDASSLNLAAGEVRPNLVTVPLGADGRISLFTQAPGHLVADVIGWFTDNTSPESSAGLFVPVSPTRVLDTRTARLAPLGVGETIRVAIGGSTVDPDRRAAAVVVNATVTAATQAGFVTLWPAGQIRPLSSNLNANRPGQTVPNAAVVGLGTGAFDAFSQSGTHLVFDVAGWFQS